MTKEEFDKWADKACRYCYDKAISGEVNLNFYAFQSEPLIEKQPELLILGLNPHGSDPYWDGKFIPPYEEAIERFSKGNPHYGEKDSWNLWQGLKRVFQKGDIADMLQDDYPYMYMNVLYFNTDDIDIFKSYDKSGNIFRENVNLTAELIQLLKPKHILCLSINECFNRIKSNFTDCRTLIPSFLAAGQWGNIPVYGIRHPSYGNKGEALTGKSLKYLFDRDQQQTVSADEYKQAFADDLKLLAEQLAQPSLAKENKIKIATSAIDLIKKKSGLTVHPTKKETLYTNNEKLYITITSTGDGYVAIRHSDCKGYNKGIIHEKEGELRDLLKKFGYREENVWLGTKLFKSYNTDAEKIPQAIAEEVEKLLPLIEEIMK
jgi:hypothetical protein